MKILIAEDDPAYRRLLEAGLHHDARQLMIVTGIFSVIFHYIKGFRRQRGRR